MIYYKKYLIYKIPFWVSLISRAKGLMFMGKVYLREKYYNELKNGKPSIQTLGYLEHEIEHTKSDFLRHDKFAIKYWTNSKIRLREELKASIAEMKVYKKKGKKFDINRRAKSWSSFGYLWMTDYKNAKEILEKEWKKI